MTYFDKNHIVTNWLVRKLAFQANPRSSDCASEVKQGKSRGCLWADSYIWAPYYDPSYNPHTTTQHRAALCLNSLLVWLLHSQMGAWIPQPSFALDFNAIRQSETQLWTGCPGDDCVRHEVLQRVPCTADVGGPQTLSRSHRLETGLELCFGGFKTPEDSEYFQRAVTLWLILGPLFSSSAKIALCASSP